MIPMNEARGGRTLYEAYVASMPPRVLLAEDDPELRRLIASELRRDGITVIEARDGHELVELLAEDLGSVAPDVVVSDLRMPGPSGLDALDLLRRTGGGPAFVLITAFGDEAIHEQAARLGAAAVFDKPFDLDDLTTALVAITRENRGR